jgi:hypothetical protein
VSFNPLLTPRPRIRLVQQKKQSMKPLLKIILIPPYPELLTAASW